MAVSKRTRFEVLKRDNHTCRYCGATPPDTVLHVDHVIPVALGGSDNPDNLVAACKDCNAGKTSTTANDTIVADVKTEALAYAAALRENLKEITKTYKGIRAVKRQLTEAWAEIAANAGWRNTPPMGHDFGASLHNWLKMGLTPDFIEYAMEIAMGKDDVTFEDTYRYFCGVIWRTLDNAHAQVQQGDPEPETCGHCDWCLETPEDGYCDMYNPHDPTDERIICHVCGSPTCLYAYGWQEGNSDGCIDTYEKFEAAIIHYRECPEVNRG